MKNKSHLKKIKLTSLLLVILFGASSFIILKFNHERKEKNDSKNKMYVCSMEPQIIRDKPGDCPICGMALIEKKDFDENYADSRLDDVVRPVNQTVLASVRTVTPVKDKRTIMIEASGIINYDERFVRTVSANFEGLIERSYVKYLHQPIRKGQKIYDIYCPEFFKEKYSYVLLMKKYAGQPEMAVDARNYLKQFGLTEEQISDLSASDKINYHLSVYSKVDGFVVSSEFDSAKPFDRGKDEDNPIGIASGKNTGIGLIEGVMVAAGTPLFKVVETKSVRADLKIRNEDAGFLRTGQTVILSDIVNPDRKIKATISHIEPLTGGLFQLVKVYITDTDHALLPGMKIHASINAGQCNSLWVPKSSVTNMGLHDAVFQKDDSIFIARIVITGAREGDNIEIRKGLDENSSIAANASLLTDSDGLINTSLR